MQSNAPNDLVEFDQDMAPWRFRMDQGFYKCQVGYSTSLVHFQGRYVVHIQFILTIYFNSLRLGLRSGVRLGLRLSLRLSLHV